MSNATTHKAVLASNKDNPEIPTSDPELTDFSPQDIDFEIELDVGDVHTLLKNDRRRLVLYYLKEIEESTEVSELSEHIAAIENEKDRAKVTAQERKRVYVSLYQRHLPKLSENGLVNYDNQRGTVELEETAQVVDPFLYTHHLSSPNSTTPNFFDSIRHHFKIVSTLLLSTLILGFSLATLAGTSTLVITATILLLSIVTLTYRAD